MSNPNMKSMVDNFMGSMGLPKPSEAPEGQGASNPISVFAKSINDIFSSFLMFGKNCSWKQWLV